MNLFRNKSNFTLICLIKYHKIIQFQYLMFYPNKLNRLNLINN